MKNSLRTLVIAACFALSFASAQAQVITAERAQEIANSFFQNSKQKNAAARSTAAMSLKKSADSRILSSENCSDVPTFHILTPTSGKGFVIISGEEMENPIIGYSFDSEFITEGEMPTGLTDYLADIDAQVKALRKYNAENPQKAAAARNAMQKTNYAADTMGDKVYLETASWGQDYPFNTQCFTSYGGSTNALTGCVPTAYAIIMRYHEWPQVGTGTLYNCQAPTYVEITDRTYDYSKMPLVYDGNWSTEQINEVAKLMSHLGHSFMVTYGSSQTSVSDPSNTDKPNKYFNYNLVYASYQANFTIDTWKEKIKESIDNGCPIPYASDNAGTGDTRHMFVLDGYTVNDYFHFNFGWSGGSNGWFKLDAIKPSQGDNYSWQGGADHYAIFNFTPNKTKYTVNASVSPTNAGTVSINGGAAAESVTGEYLEGATVTLAATANTGYTFSNWTKGNEIVSTSKSCQAKVASSDNDYVANFLTVGNTTVNVSVTYNSSYGTVTGTSGTVANGTTLTPYLNEEITLTATPLEGYIFTGWTMTKGTESTNYPGTSLTLVATGEMSVTANFMLAVVDYNMIIDNVSPSGSSTGARNSTWTYNIDNNHPAALKLQSSNGSKEVYGLSNTSNRLYAYVYDANDTGYSSATYTLSVPDEYIITSYNLTYWVSNSYKGQVTVSNGTTTETPNDTNNHYLTATPNAQTAQFTISTSQVGQQYITIESFIVTVMKDGAGGGSTPTPAQYTITATANPITAGSVTGGGTYNEGATVTLTATPNSGYKFVNWTNGTSTISEEATTNVTITANSNFIANFEKVEAIIPDYPTPTGATYTDNYLTSITTTGGDTNIDYSANEHPNQLLVVVPGKVQLAKGESFTMNLAAKSLGEGSNSTVHEDMRYCHASLFTDFDQDHTFQAAAVQTWGNNPPSNNVYGNYDEVMNITHTITVPDDAPAGESRVRIIYTNAWNGWPSNGTANLDKGIVYDIVVEVVEKVDYTIEENAYYRFTCAGGDKKNLTSATDANDNNRLVMGNANDLFYYSNSTLLAYHEGKHLGVVSSADRYNITLVTETPVKTSIVPSEGLYYIAIGSSGDYGNGYRYLFGAYDNIDSGTQETGYPTADGYKWNVEKASSLPVNFGKTGWATIFAPVALEIPDGVTAYYVMEDGIKNGYISLTTIEEGVIPANTGVILYAKEADGTDKTYEFAITDCSTELTANLLKGSIAQSIIEEKGYVLAVVEGAVGLYSAITEGLAEETFLNNSHKAYLPASAIPAALQQSTGFRFGEGVTDIDNVKTQNIKSKTIYDMQGRKVENPAKGIYIINGKKTFIR